MHSILAGSSYNRNVNYYEVAPKKIVRGSSTTFTYHTEETLKRGSLVRIPVGKQELEGIVVKRVTQPTYDTKEIATVIESRPLPEQLIDLANWLSDYYTTHLALVWQTILPRGASVKRRNAAQAAVQSSIREKTVFTLNDEQSNAIRRIELMPQGSALLHGVTGSGKTAVYIELAKRTLSRGKSVIVLVPEIALTSQLVDEFSTHFGSIILTHSRQTEAQRHAAWREALYSDTPRVVIGPRSALFMPLSSIGLVIADEAHEPSYKQEQSPRYNALRAASVLAKLHNAKLVLGSATPGIADYYLAKETDHPIVELVSTAKNTTKPSVKIVNMTEKTARSKHRFLSPALLEGIEKTLAADKQVLIFHNRRGSASVTLCEDCGWQAFCPDCYLPMTLHGDRHELRCHICARKERVPTSCPVCHSAEVLHKGIGTKVVESELTKLYPNKKVVRFDADQDNDTSVDKKYAELYNGEIDIIIGTQVIAKGLDLPHLSLVGVVQADAGLNMPDFGAAERTFQLLAQVVGRVGRHEAPTDVVVQSFQPNHYAIKYGLEQKYERFYTEELRARKQGLYPPYTHMAKLTCSYKTEAAAIKNAKKLTQQLRTEFGDQIKIVGPAPAFYERIRDTYRWQIVLKSANRTTLAQAVRLTPKTNWQVELDPFNLL